MPPIPAPIRPLRKRQQVLLEAGGPRLAERQKVFGLGLIFGNGFLKIAEHGRPKFDAIQIIVQTFQRFQQIADNHFFRWFRHRCRVFHLR